MENELYTPQVKAKPEYFPGFGKKELYSTGVMSIFVVFFSIIFYLFNGEIASVVLNIIIGIIGSVILNTKNDAELSIVTFVGLIIKYMREQQQFLYRYLDEWKF